MTSAGVGVPIIYKHCDSQLIPMVGIFESICKEYIPKSIHEHFLDIVFFSPTQVG